MSIWQRKSKPATAVCRRTSELSSKDAFVIWNAWQVLLFSWHTCHCDISAFLELSVRRNPSANDHNGQASLSPPEASIAQSVGVQQQVPIIHSDPSSNDYAYDVNSFVIVDPEWNIAKFVVAQVRSVEWKDLNCMVIIYHHQPFYVRQETMVRAVSIKRWPTNWKIQGIDNLRCSWSATTMVGWDIWQFISSEFRIFY